MSVRKFRRVEDMPEATARDTRSTEALAALGALWRRSRLLFPRRFPPGVYRHRSIEALNRLQDAWLEEAIRTRSAARP